MSDAVAALREAFDRAFAAAPALRGAAPVGLLAVRVGDDPYAFRLSELVGLHHDPAITPYPADAWPALLGLAAFRGEVAPVYDLAQMFGAPPRPAPRWVALARAGSLVALAFDRFEAHVEVDDAAPPGATRDGAMVRGAVRVAGASRPVVDVASVIDAIGRRARRP